MTRTAGPKQQLRVSCPRSHPGLRAPPSAVPGSPAPSGSPVRHGAPVAPGGTVCEGRAGRGRDRRPGRSFPVPSRPVPSSHPGSPGARWGKVLARPPDRRRRGGRCRTLLNTSRSSSSSSSASTSAAASSGPRAVPRAPAARCESTPGPSPPAGSGGPGSRPSACILPCERGRRPRHSRSPRDRNWRLPRPPLAAAGPGGAPSAQEWKRRREGRAGSERGRVGSLPAGPGSGRGGLRLRPLRRRDGAAQRPQACSWRRGGPRPGRSRGCRGTGRAAHGTAAGGSRWKVCAEPRSGDLRALPGSRPLCPGQPPAGRDIARLLFLRSPGWSFSLLVGAQCRHWGSRRNPRVGALSLASRTAPLGQPLCRSWLDPLAVGSGVCPDAEARNVLLRTK